VTAQRLDRVAIFGDQLSFLIPHEWVESDEADDYCLYHAPDTDSGWLRVSLISNREPSERLPEELRSLLAERADKRNGRLFESGSNIVVEWMKDSEQDGDPITQFWWAVAHYHGPTLSHEALFSYTVLTVRKTDAETLRTVELVRELVSQAKFTPPKVA
jgi:hypothetical protein